MQNNTLLYILPDVTYFAELLPTKKEFTFAIQNFRQINGEFMGDNTFEVENIDKLFGKIKDTSFTSLILPDYLFTDTIVSVKETDEKKVISHLKEELLPSLGITTDSHYVNTFVLAQFKGESRVQISALEKSVLAPVRVSAKKHGISFEGVTALSWSIKSLISLEPSISIVQAGSKLYTSLHYIGIDQTTVAELDETSNISETIKTLKGGEPSIQTIYLLSNEVVEENLKEELKATVPIQQVASFKEEDTKIPSYVKQLIEAGMKTLSIPDYLAPSFEVSKPLANDEETIAALSISESEESDEEEDALDNSTATGKEKTEATRTVDELPTPTVPAVATSQVKALDLDKVEDATSKTQEDTEEEPSIEPITSVDETLEKDTEKPEKKEVDEEKQEVSEQETSEAEETTVDLAPTTASPVSSTNQEEKENHMSAIKDEELTTVEETSDEDNDVIDLRQFSKEGSLEIEEDSEEPKKKTTPNKILKNQSGVGSMMKMIFITVAVFFATVAIGVGVGLGLLKVTQQGETVTPAVETVEASPEPSPSPKPEVVEFDPTGNYSVLVVNATTKAGYAGTIKSDLIEAEFEDVDAANAKGEYEEGNFILVDEEIPGLLTFIEEATDLNFELDTENKSQEDAAEAYDFVVVLAE
ncbi:MAG: hypothetical protein H6773_00855 [Pseudomonadales bacterium]|nr:hypothetical protein [Pseudomonadales bacterium]